MAEKLPPSATAIRWFLIAKGEVEFKNQMELADAIGLDYSTLKHGLAVLRKKDALERIGKRIGLRSSFR